MHAPFFLNHTSFFFYSAVIKVELTGQVPEHQQYSIEQFNAAGRHIGYLETGVIKPRRGIDVSTVGHAIVLQDIHHVDIWKVAGALKGDMFNKVGQSSLVLFLNEGSGILYQPEFGAPFGLLVVADIICHTVIQPAYP